MVKSYDFHYLVAVDSKNIDDAKAALSVAYKELDKAVSKGILKKNTVSRTKSRLATKVQALNA